MNNDLTSKLQTRLLLGKVKSNRDYAKSYEFFTVYSLVVNGASIGTMNFDNLYEAVLYKLPQWV